jgi:hypothetical protein
VLIGRPALDEDAIRSIEEQHPHIEFDWPAILALREAMPPEEEAEPARPSRPRRQGRREAPRAAAASAEPRAASDASVEMPDEVRTAIQDDAEPLVAGVEPPAPTTRGLLEELVGRDIATRLRGRHAEIMARIHEQSFDEATLAAWVARAEPLDPDTWLTPDAVLAGVRDADSRFEALRSALLGR